MSKIDLLRINDPKGELPDSFYKFSIKKEINLLSDSKIIEEKEYSKY